MTSVGGGPTGGTTPVPVSQAPGVNPQTQCVARLHGSPRDATLVLSLLIEGHSDTHGPRTRRFLQSVRRQTDIKVPT